MFRFDKNPFKLVECPDLLRFGDCSVVNCMFKHDVKRSRPDSEEPDEPKRIKLDEEVAESQEKLKDVEFIIPKALTTGLNIPRSVRLSAAKRISQFIKKKGLSSTPNRFSIDKEHEIASESKTIEQYNTKVEAFTEEEQKSRVDPKFIMPIEVNPAPETLPQRRKCIEYIVAAIKQKQPDLKTPILAGIEEEHKIATKYPLKASYTHAIRKRLFEIKNPEKVKSALSRAPSKSELLSELRKNILSRETLKKYGFIMERPQEIPEFKPVRTCQRCKVEFKLEDALKEVKCCYHAGKPIKNEHNVRIYLCCGGVLGTTDSVPCATWNHHVFYWESAEEMHRAIPFVETQLVWGTKKGSLEAVGIDCEMGYTDRGFELLRITAIDFFSGEEAFDILVKPKGVVLDLNTRWSGVAEVKPEAVTFEDSIALLGEVIDSNTILVGHGLENDMNAMRLIHDKIVDTAVLYPRNKTSPTFRYALKNLAFKYLGRNIQAGQHDSGEDSIAAIDITKYFLQKDIEREAREKTELSRSQTSETGGAVFRSRLPKKDETTEKDAQLL